MPEGDDYSSRFGTRSCIVPVSKCGTAAVTWAVSPEFAQVTFLPPFPSWERGFFFGAVLSAEIIAESTGRSVQHVNRLAQQGLILTTACMARSDSIRNR